MAKPLVIISSRSFSTGKLDLDKILKDSGCETRKISTTHELSEISSDLKDAVAWIAGVAPITTEMLDLAPNLRIISRYGVGVDSVDLGAAKKHGVLVANTPGANSNSVAELALSLMFSAIRNLSESNANVRSNNWKAIRGKEINSMVIGVVGYGKIGRLVANKLNLLGAKVLVNDPYVSDPAIVDLSVINKTAELVTLHSPGDEQIINNKWINDAPKGQIIINSG
jgi:D-3-phosphoglycerate dehydrogenase